MANVLFGSPHFVVVMVFFGVVQLCIFRIVWIKVFYQTPASTNGGNIGNYQVIDSYWWTRKVQRTQANKMQMMYYEQGNNVRAIQRHKIPSKYENIRAPSLEYEKTRRRLRSIIEDFSYYFGAQMKCLQEDISNNQKLKTERIGKILNHGNDYKIALLQEVRKLSRFDGFNDWRFREAAELSDLVQRRLRFLQNPKDCRTARKLVCNLRKMCGFGCQLHHVVYCLITAYSTRRTMILLSQGWRYNVEGWGSVFLPVSETCNDAGMGNRTSWKGFNDPSQAVDLPIVESFQERGHPYLPPAVPADLAERIAKLHEVPAVWWVGQMVKFLMRLKPRTNNMTIEAEHNMMFKHPIVGVHIRRTDKLNNEAAFHAVDEYMSHVEGFYEQLSFPRKAETKRIYLASDDVHVFEEISKKYPDYTIVGNPNISQTAAGPRYCSKCLDGLIVDLHLLASSDFLVCTFSSQVCRVAYEIMQTLHPDAAARFRSLDDSYYFGGGGIHKVVAVISHRATSKDQIDLKIGDHVKLFGNLWNGFSEGFNFRTSRIGKFPSYKVEDVIEATDFPYVYSEVPVQSAHRMETKKIQYTDYHYLHYVINQDLIRDMLTV